VPAEAGERFESGGFEVQWKIDGHHAADRVAIGSGIADHNDMGEGL
jgi:hypothetical protein